MKKYLPGFLDATSCLPVVCLAPEPARPRRSGALPAACVVERHAGAGPAVGPAGPPRPRACRPRGAGLVLRHGLRPDPVQRPAPAGVARPGLSVRRLLCPGTALTVSASNGFGKESLWPDTTRWSDMAISVLGKLTPAAWRFSRGVCSTLGRSCRDRADSKRRAGAGFVAPCRALHSDLFRPCRVPSAC